MDADDIIRQGRELADKLQRGAGEQVAQHEQQIKSTLGKVVDFVNDKTSGKYAEQVGKVAGYVGHGVDTLAAHGRPTDTGAPAPGADAPTSGTPAGGTATGGTADAGPPPAPPTAAAPPPPPSAPPPSAPPPSAPPAGPPSPSAPRSGDTGTEGDEPTNRPPSP
ncbi:MAG TPA: antitoxin [Pseudonocardia sp.]